MNYKKTAYCRKCVSERKNNDCRERPCRNQNPTDFFPSDKCDTGALAMVYGISQRWQNICDGETGFERGTIFEELYMPFMGDKCRNGGCCK